MSRYRIFATARPSARGLPVVPMSKVDEAFWHHRPRAAAEAKARREAKEQAHG